MFVIVFSSPGRAGWQSTPARWRRVRAVRVGRTFSRAKPAHFAISGAGKVGPGWAVACNAMKFRDCSSRNVSYMWTHRSLLSHPIPFT